MSDEEYIKNISSISTEKLFNSLEYYGYDSYYADLVEATIEELKKRFEERPHGEWIPVSERLPKQGNQAYLVTVDYGDGLLCSCERFFFGEGIGWNDDCVTAWMPLPEAYKKETDNETDN